MTQDHKPGFLYDQIDRISHELQAPLNAILGYAQLLEMNTDLPGDAVSSAREIRQAGQQLLALTDSILGLARIEAGEVTFTLEDVAVGKLLALCVSQNLPQATMREASIDMTAGCRACVVRADRHRLSQVINNLIGNALKNSPKRGGRITLDCMPASGGGCRISITDMGEPANAQATTISLIIARQLVQSMGGAMGSQAGPQGGCTFWIDLPVPAPVAPAASGPATPADNTPQGGGLRVLVAEDFPPNQKILRLQLSSLGYEVELADDGAQALAKWRERRHDLILSDLDMPVMNGLELARAVRQQEQQDGGHVPILAITAAAMASELQRCRDAGMDDALTKPISREDLGAAIERWRPTQASAQPPAPAALPATAPASPAVAPAVFDLTALYRILGQVDVQQARELVDAFIESSRQGLASLAQHPGDGAALAREMHKQKSSARTVGALRYAGLVERLEQAAHDKTTDVPARLAELRSALEAVRLEAARLPAQAQPTVEEAVPQASCKSVLVVDDDEVVLRQVKSLLLAMGVPEVLTATNGMEAIVVMGERGGELEVVMCDLNMPEMDGIELIRRFGQTSFKGGVILISGADQQVLSTASRLAELQGLRVLGQVSKPVMPQPLADMLARLQDKVQAKQRGQARPAPLVTVEAMREAMARDEFTVWFQPKVDATTLRPTGVEALARWRRPDGGFVPPDLFITLAEREGMIGELSRLLMARAFRELSLVHEAGYKLKLAVNLSGKWLDDLHLPEIILGMSQEAGIDVRYLVLEVTETGVMEDLTTALDVLTRLRLKGFGLSIDDFGIGYSSFEQLGRIPFTEMKLDRSFVNKGNHSPAARAILESSMDMAKKLGLTTVAEGVETQEELALVRALGCNNIQGWLIAKGMPVDELLVWLGQTTRSAPA